MNGYVGNIEKETLENVNFRKVLYTGQHAQLVVMHLNPLEDIGLETHEIVDQFIRIEKGDANLTLGEATHEVHEGDAFIIPAGTAHNVTNTSSNNPVKIYTIYSPAHHKDMTMHKTKAEAEADHEDHI